MLFAESTALSAPDPFPQPAESCPPLPAEPPHAADLRCSRSCAAQAPGAGGGKPAPQKSFAGFRPAQTATAPRPTERRDAAPAAGMVSSDDDRDRGLKFGFRAQQRMRERERREKSKDERKKREREADEEREMMKDVAKRISEGDLRARVLAKVAEQLKTDEVQARLTEQVDTARAAMRKVRGGVRL